MLIRYHVSKDGNPRPCEAPQGECKLSAHYDTMASARASNEAKNKHLNWPEPLRQSAQKKASAGELRKLDEIESIETHIDSIVAEQEELVEKNFQYFKHAHDNAALSPAEQRLRKLQLLKNESWIKLTELVYDVPSDMGSGTKPPMSMYLNIMKTRFGVVFIAVAVGTAISAPKWGPQVAKKTKALREKITHRKVQKTDHARYLELEAERKRLTEQLDRLIHSHRLVSNKHLRESSPYRVSYLMNNRVGKSDG